MIQSATTNQLAQIVSGPPPTTIADVLALMQRIDNLLPSGDGLKWFNLLYMMVTRQVDSNPPPSGWKDAAWLIEARFGPVIERIQFALAGMNAHINHDLALALLQTNAELNLVPDKTSPEHDDFERVNGLLEATLPQALQFLAAGILGELAQDTGRIGSLLAIWKVSAARDLAWDLADHFRSLIGIGRTTALRVQDQITGVVGRSLLRAI